MRAPDRGRRPDAGPQTVLRLPDFERTTLPNGLRVWVAPRQGLPEVAVSLVVDAGAAASVAEQSGIASLTGQLLTEGAAGRTAQEMARWLDRLGAGFSVSVGHDVAVMSLHVLSEVLDDALDYLAAAVTAPAFEPAEVDRVRQERLDEIKRRRDDSAELANEVLIRGLFGAHAYGRPPRGTIAGVSSLDAEAVRGYYGLRYSPDGATLIVVGDVEGVDLTAQIAERVLDWQGDPGGAPVPEPPDTPDAAGRVLLVDRPHARQSEIRLGTIGLARGAEDEFDVMVANAILGGLFNSRINMNLREDKGWTYGARTSFAFRRQPGPFVARAAVETGVTRRALDEIFGEIERMLTDPPSEMELQLARNALTLSLPRQFETASQIAGKISQNATYDLPEDYWLSYSDRVEAVDADRVRRVIERYLAPERLVLVAVTDAAKVGKDIEGLGVVDQVDAPCEAP